MLVRPFVSEVVWRVVALEPPRVLRRCPRCDALRPFVSSERFRVNAHKRRLDVWLIYRCGACDDTWNLSVARDVTPEELGAARLRAYHENDAEAAWACAAVAADPEQPIRVERERPGPALPYTIVFALPRPCRLRADRLIARELGLPRSALGYARGLISDGLRVRLGPEVTR
jgi:hypothetical protein